MFKDQSSYDFMNERIVETTLLKNSVNNIDYCRESE